MADLIEALEMINREMAAGPWNEDAVGAAIRHVQRNTDVMQDTLEYASEGDPRGLPDRYDGNHLAKLRNLLPEIIEALQKAEGM